MQGGPDPGRGIGSLEPSPWLVGSGNTFSIEELQSLEDKGAVGNICPRFYNANGEEITDALAVTGCLGLNWSGSRAFPW
jgi:DNA-binding transcriptional regulator LsrR (DeoR family)